MAEALSYFEHNAKRIELDVVEWVPPPEDIELKSEPST